MTGKPARQRRIFGIPEARGPLRTYRMCDRCKGSGAVGVPGTVAHGYCFLCRGMGRLELLDETYESVAEREARQTVRKTQGPGRKGRDM